MIEFRFPTGTFLFVSKLRPVLEPKLTPMQWVPEVLCLEMEKPEREADHCHSASKEMAYR
jgi:hypothetical protein